jgi:hypothetical protein
LAITAERGEVTSLGDHRGVRRAATKSRAHGRCAAITGLRSMRRRVGEIASAISGGPERRRRVERAAIFWVARGTDALSGC